MYIRVNYRLISFILEHIEQQLKATTIIEWLAFLFGVAQVILALKNKAINFYAGILSVCLYIYVFYTYGLYAESILNLYYLFVSVAGIFLWRQKNQASITFTTSREWVVTLLTVILSWGVLFLILKNFTPSTVPFLDAFVTAAAWAGTWLLIKRKVENWIILNLSNIVAIPLQIYKDLELTSLLTCIYVVVAIVGYIEWRKNACRQTSN
jgi:nicotinamide mononucleotide transporter